MRRSCRLQPTRLVLRATFAAAACVLLVAPGAAWASHDLALFELEGNAVAGGASGDDWTSLFPADHAGELARVFVADGTSNPSDASYFTGGGSKDTNNIGDWAWTTGDVAPDKDELADAFAAAYRSPSDTGKTNTGDLMLYFGTDRYANNGDAQIGFWFFRGAVGLAPGGTFSGTHTNGDILVLSDFTQGGRVGTVRVFRWVGSGGSDGPLDLLSSGLDCADAAPDDGACSVENASAATAPWSYVPKSGSAGTFPTGSFYEGGINVTRLAGVRCFKTYMVETRSSQAIGAQLKDTVLGPFDTCPASAAGAPPAGLVAAPGPALPATGVAAGAAGVGGLLVAIGSAVRRSSRSRALRRRPR